ncbi:hypothetical protein [Streptomyces sediminimaris]|uniref:hypothetical protein n=1 Tax=Streptomyces sediminimaris TaxID=3383721 RepID=UPI00399AC1A9
MADHGDKERFTLLGETVMGMLEYLRELLLNLPIPVDIPDFLGEDGPNHDAVMALDRARDLIDDEPVSEDRKTAYGHLILEWFTAYEMLVLRRIAGPAPWRLDAAQFAIARFTIIAEMIENGAIDEHDES